MGEKHCRSGFGHFSKSGCTDPFVRKVAISQAAANRARLIDITKRVNAIERTVVSRRCMTIGIYTANSFAVLSRNAGQ